MGDNRSCWQAAGDNMESLFHPDLGGMGLSFGEHPGGATGNTFHGDVLPSSPGLPAVGDWEGSESLEQHVLMDSLDPEQSEFHLTAIHPVRIATGPTLPASLEPSRILEQQQRDAQHRDQQVEVELQDEEPIVQFPKIGNRFSSGSVKVLKTWLAGHVDHPYPSPADIEVIQRRTGLSHQQIINWISNSRRRLRQQKALRPSTKYIRSLDTTSSSSIAEQIPARPPRRPSPAPFESLNPLQRWEHSPPDEELADASAIARAFDALDPSASTSVSSLPQSMHRPARAPKSIGSAASSASSAGTSHSSGSSFASAWSRASHGSIENLRRAIKRRRRRITEADTVAKNANPSNMLLIPAHMFQCTFCTETFKTKHNWQRHEKSLHLSLEQWYCSPDGPVVENRDRRPSCVYCGFVEPDDAHLQVHNHQACAQRLIEDRMFYRKDHLQQHLKLVHNARFERWPMERWKTESGETIRSRCGFCESKLTNWADRADHIADHFRDGKTMDDWKGDWGFEQAVLDMVENAIAPYLIPYERDSPWPFTHKMGPPETPSSAYNLIQLELDHFVLDQSATDANGKPWTLSDAELQYEACSILFGADLVNEAEDGKEPSRSWLRDLLLLSSADIAAQARVRPMKSAARSRFTALKIRGKHGIFEGCDMEAQLMQSVDVTKILGLEVPDSELQREAVAIVRRTDEASPSTETVFGDLLVRLAQGSTAWLAPFRERAGLAPSSSSGEVSLPSTGQVNSALPGSIAAWSAAQGTVTATRCFTPNYSAKKNTPASVIDVSCYKRLARGLARFVVSTMSMRNPNMHVPTDEELQHQARWIWYDDDDPWNQTPADNPDWLREFKRSVGIGGGQGETEQPGWS